MIVLLEYCLCCLFCWNTAWLRDKNASMYSYLSWRNTHFEQGCFCTPVWCSHQWCRCSHCSQTNHHNPTNHQTTHDDSAFFVHASCWASSSGCSSSSWAEERIAWAWDWGRLVPPWQHLQGAGCPASPYWWSEGPCGDCWLNEEEKWELIRDINTCEYRRKHTNTCRALQELSKRSVKKSSHVLSQKRLVYRVNSTDGEDLLIWTHSSWEGWCLNSYWWYLSPEERHKHSHWNHFDMSQ